MGSAGHHNADADVLGQALLVLQMVITLGHGTQERFPGQSCLDIKCVCVCVLPNRVIHDHDHQEVTGCRQLGCDHGGVAEVGESGDDTTLPQRKVIKLIIDRDIHEALT